MRLPLPAAFALAGLAVAGAFLGRSTGASVPDGTVLAQRDLLFQDRADGAVLVLAAADRQLIEVFAGEQGFLRGTLRSFARTRRMEQQGPETPFRLARWADGRLTLDDPATGQHAELLAFGADNATVFARLLGGTP